MKNIKIFALAAVAAFGLASCSNEENGGTPDKIWNDGDIAYMAIDVNLAKATRSGEEAGIESESAIKSLYLITLDADNNVLGIPGGSAKYIMLSAGASAFPPKPDPQKVSAAAKKLVAIANPGTELLAVLNSMTVGQAWSVINAAIADVTIGEINGTQGFTMITAGDAKGKTGVAVGTDATTANKVETPFVNIDGKVKVIESTEGAAKELADEDRVDVFLERLASKLTVNALDDAALAVQPAGATFYFGNWTVDAVNTTFYPFAVKTLTDGTHIEDGRYAYHFYTQDPNYDDVTPPAYHTGLKYGKADPENNFEPELPQEEWLAKGTATAYVIENTMAAGAQRFGNATRIVIKAEYYPEGFTKGADWFSFAGVNYKTFAELQTAYAAAADGSDLKKACDAFAAEIGDGTTDFADLDASDLEDIENGGDVMKKTNDKTPIRWYQGGRNYYYYEIRHDNERDGTMLFSKYGVVRNNSYKLTLNEVSGAGTPWYPDLVNPGDGDPKPEDPIDTASGFLGITVEVNPWIVWETGFGI